MAQTRKCATQPFIFSDRGGCEKYSKKNYNITKLVYTRGILFSTILQIVYFANATGEHVQILPHMFGILYGGPTKIRDMERIYSFD